MADLPVRFKERMKELLGEGYEAFEASYDKERVQGLRLNSLKTADGIREDWEEEGAHALARLVEGQAGLCLEKIPWVKEALESGSPRPGNPPDHEARRY